MAEWANHTVARKSESETRKVWRGDETRYPSRCHMATDVLPRGDRPVRLGGRAATVRRLVADAARAGAK